MTEIIKIDARVTGFSNDEIRLISLCFADSGQILVQKTEIFTALAVRPDQQTDTIVVTDSPNFNPKLAIKI
ncbi:hypothetical protein MMP70_11115 [Acinetobacter modestus]|nr:hypothetical protein [Acinetobacter modestus]MCH7330220.1 hypothetical protein [Acinetobacter modestus]